MKRNLVSGIILTLLALSVFTAYDAQPVRAVGTIYIRADGSVDPPTAPIQRDGDLYTLTGNITSDTAGIVIERGNITLDGAGWTIRGMGTDKGIQLSGVTHVTVRNTRVDGFYYGIYASSSGFINISENDITANDVDGIYVDHSAYNLISGNNMTGNNCGIELRYCSDSSISGNNVTANREGIGVIQSDNNDVKGNNITDNAKGISLGRSSYNSVIGNAITANDYGIWIDSSSRNRLYHNNFIGNTQQVGVLMPGFANFWDDGYPSGGNYWSNYNGTDLYHGQYQNETGSDGIGDTPYIIDSSNSDKYPLTLPYNPRPWDLTGPMAWAPDDKCDIRDIALVATLFGSRVDIGKYDRRADLTGPTYLVPDLKIDIRDLALIAKHYGETYP